MSESLDFSAVMGLSVLPNGGFVLASDVKNDIQFFDAKGQLIRSIGRNGSGPGEFRGVQAFFRFRDSLALIDMREVGQVFTLEGKYVRSEKSISPATFIHGYLADGSRVLGTLQTEQIVAGRWSQATERLERWSGETSTLLGTFPSQELSRAPGGRLMGNVYSPRNRVAVFDKGFCAGYAGKPIIECHDKYGKRLSAFTLVNARPVAVTKQDEEAYFNDIYEVNEGEPREKLDAQVRAARDRVTFAKSMGVFGALLASRDGLLWVGPPSTDDGRRINPNPAPTQPTSWRVYSTRGQWLANVTLPARFYLLEAGRDYLAGITRDSDNLEVVVIYQLNRR
jgi:hypothetical protein